MKGLISYFIKYPISGNVLVLLILIFGFVGLSNMRSTFFPETETKIIAVQIIYPGASPEEIEEGVVSKIEDNLEGLSGIDKVTSTSSENSGRVIVQLERGFDIDVLLQDVKNAVDQINSFPDNMESPVIYKQEVLTRAVTFVIGGDTDLKTLKKFAREIERDLLAKEGVSKVELSGFPEEEIEIAVNEDALRAYQMTFDQVVQAVRNANIEVTGGTIKAETEELLIRSKSKEYYAKDFLDIVVTTTLDGRKVYLVDVATVKDRWADNPNRTYLNGQPGVSVNVSNTIEESLLDIADIVKEYIDEFNEANEVVEARIIEDATVALNQRIDLLVNNGIIGFILVVILLAMFLEVKLAFWVAIAIPVSFMGMFMLAGAFGISINIISLFGMILVIGILVDDGIVIGENIYSKYEQGMNPIRAAIEGAMEVLPAVLSAILTTMIAFGSFLYFEGVLGDFFGQMALVVILTLGFSLIEGTFILPGHIAHAVGGDHHEEENPQEIPLSEGEENVEVYQVQAGANGIMEELHEEAYVSQSLGARIGRFLGSIQRGLWSFMDWMKNGLYAPALRFFMNNILLGMAIPLCILLLCFGLFAAGWQKFTFFPPIEGDLVTVTLAMPAGTREQVTDKWLTQIEKASWEVSANYKKERADGKDVVIAVNKNLGPTTYEGTVLIKLLDNETRNTSSREIIDRIRKATGPVYGAETLTFGGRAAFGSPVSIALTGDNLESLEAAADELVSGMEELPDVRDITSSNKEGLREINLTLKEKARLLGLTTQQVVGQVRQGFFGAEVQRLQRGKDEVKVWVRYTESDRSSVGNLENMRIRTPDGSSYPLQELADFKMERGVIEIQRLNGQREIRINADVASDDVSVSEVNSTIENDILPPILEKHSDVRYLLEGQAKESQDFANSSGSVLPIVLMLIFVIIILTFRSVSQTLSVFAIIPFGLIGVILGHYMLGKPLSILSVLGIFALVGIIVNDALVLVSAHNLLLQKGKTFRDALYEASLSRFRPIFLTSITTIAGLTPLLFEKSLQAQFLIPMAISVSFGLAAATLLILLLLPTFLMIANWWKGTLVALYEGERPDAASIEAAVPNRKKYYALWFGGSMAVVALIFIVIFIVMLFMPEGAPQ